MKSFVIIAAIEVEALSAEEAEDLVMDRLQQGEYMYIEIKEVKAIV